MKRFMQFILAAAVVAMGVSPTLAQEQQQQPLDSYGFTVLLLIHRQKSVQEELKLSDEQVKKVAELWEKQAANRPKLRGLSREEMQQKLRDRLKAQNEAVANILNAKQFKRAQQITLQWHLKQSGLSSTLDNKEIAKALEITNEQKDKLRAIRTKEREDLRGFRYDEEGRKKREEIHKAANEKVNAVLIAEQKTKLKNLQGEPFKGKIDFRPIFERPNQ